MSVRTLGRRAHGACIATASFDANGTAYAVNANGRLAAGPYDLDGDAYDTVLWDTDGYSGVVVPAGSVDPFDPPGGYSGNGRLVVPRGLAGLYVVTGKLYPGGTYSNATYVRATGQVTVDGGALDWDVTGLGDGTMDWSATTVQLGNSGVKPNMGAALTWFQRILPLAELASVGLQLSDAYMNLDPADPGSPLLYGYLELARLGPV